MQNSKYVQSELGDSYKRAESYLSQGRQVLFSGTPCQIAGLLSYLGKDYENLLTMEVVCHGVPSPKFWRIYINNLSLGGELISYTFRNRSNERLMQTTVASKVPRLRGTQEATVVASWGIKHIPPREDSYYGPFVRNESFRLSCYYCQYAKPERVADIMMGDCDSKKNYPDFYPLESKSILLISTDKGKKTWETVKNNFEYTELNLKEEAKVNTCLAKASELPTARKSIYKDIDLLPWKQFCSKYVPRPSIKQKLILQMKRCAKKILS